MIELTEMKEILIEETIFKRDSREFGARIMKGNGSQRYERDNENIGGRDDRNDRNIIKR